ncbi:MAG: diaminopimelate epimerase, partial [Hyphomicrobiales bacterium]|nr:diaminopimelate epimerase [Hyphomicrobiales bacterium]
HRPQQAGTDAYIEVLNSDGTTAGACGNGTRCVVSWLRPQLNKDEFAFELIGGNIDAHYQSEDSITVNMGQPRFDWEQIPVSEEFSDTRNVELQIGPIDDPVLHTPALVNIGNPHAVFWVNDDVMKYDLERLGPMLENHPIFKP